MRSSILRVAPLFAAALTASACLAEKEAFVCSEDPQCGAGRCEPTGYCSFADPSCDSGRRYGAYAGAGLAETCVSGAEADCPGNLMPDPELELGTGGWGGSSAGLTRVPGRQGMGLRACKDDTGAEDDFGMSAKPDSLAGLSPGERYSVQAWTRSDHDGLQVRAYVVEDDASGEAVGYSRGDTIVPADDWQLFGAERIITEPDASLKIRLIAVDAPDGVCFDIDSLCAIRLE